MVCCFYLSQAEVKWLGNLDKAATGVSHTPAPPQGKEDRKEKGRILKTDPGGKDLEYNLE